MKTNLSPEELETKAVEKLKEAGIEIKSPEEIEDELAERGIFDDEGFDSSDDSSDDSNEELGARTNSVKDLGGTSDSDSDSDHSDCTSDHSDETDSDDVVNEAQQAGHEAGVVGEGGVAEGDVEADDDDEDSISSLDSDIEEIFGFPDPTGMDDIPKQCCVEKLNPIEFPEASKEGFNLLFTYAFLDDGGFGDRMKTITNVLGGIEGVENFSVLAEPVEENTVKFRFTEFEG